MLLLSLGEQELLFISDTCHFALLAPPIERACVLQQDVQGALFVATRESGKFRHQGCEGGEVCGCALLGHMTTDTVSRPFSVSVLSQCERVVTHRTRPRIKQRQHTTDDKRRQATTDDNDQTTTTTNTHNTPRTQHKSLT